MSSAQDVARFFLWKARENDDDGLSNMKLQKLLYYAQGFHLAIFDQPLFPEPIEAWRHGPVVPAMYHLFKVQGRNPIPWEESDNQFELTADQTDLLDEVYDVFGQFTAAKLRQMTHEEPPWKDNWIFAGEISLDEMRSYFKTRLN